MKNLQSENSDERPEYSECQISDGVAIARLSELIEGRGSMSQEIDGEVVQNEFVDFPNHGEKCDGHHKHQGIFPKTPVEDVQMEILFAYPNNQHYLKYASAEMHQRIIAEKTCVALEI